MAEMKKYQIIYADPPWGHNDKMATHSFTQLNHYSTMTVKQICELPIKDFVDTNALLFLWAVNPMLPEALKVMSAWGFKYRTVAFCWNKKTKHGKWVSNLGRYTMGNMEICLLGRKGQPKRQVKNIKQLVIAERTKHSKKPDEVRERIATLMGDLPRIELFAREKTPGWDVWGNEVESNIKL